MNDVMIPAPTDLAGHIETLESEDETRAKLRRALAALGVTKAELSYNGSGDEGNIEEATLSTEQKAELSIPYDLHNRLADWAWDFVCGYHSGFQDNDGGFGTLTWDMATGAITLDHNDNVIDSVQTLREGV